MEPLDGKKVLLLLGPSFEDSEALYPLIRMKEAGAQVTVAGLGEKTYHGKHGIPIETDGPVEQYQDKAWDAVIIPGGWAPDKIRMNRAALTIVQNANKRGAVVAAICHAGWVLASADIVRNRRLTSYLAIKDDLVHAGAHWVDEAVVVDGNLITSRTPADLPVFCRAIIEVLGKIKAPV